MIEHSAPLSVLTFDLENRPLSYLGQDWTSSEITAMAWSWGEREGVSVMLLNLDGQYEYYLPGDAAPCLFDPDRAVDYVRGLMKSADIVTGHYIRKHDLPTLNSACMEHGVELLPSLLVSDTKEDLAKRKDLSASQENLSALFHLKNPKHHMTQSEWRKANRLGKDGLLAARKRVVDDVLQHMELRKELVARGLVKPPRIWKPFR